jgi:hypothetical protein
MSNSFSRLVLPRPPPPTSCTCTCACACYNCATCSTGQLVRKSGLATQVLRSQKGRAVQMNAGADAATSDMLCFLHADTQPPKDLVSNCSRWCWSGVADEHRG